MSPLLMMRRRGWGDSAVAALFPCSGPDSWAHELNGSPYRTITTNVDLALLRYVGDEIEAVVFALLVDVPGRRFRS